VHVFLRRGLENTCRQVFKAIQVFKTCFLMEHVDIWGQKSGTMHNCKVYAPTLGMSSFKGFKIQILAILEKMVATIL
jgi:hypothetical protein